MSAHAEREAGGLARTAPVFAALGDELRLRIVNRLAAEGPLSVKRLSAGEPVSRQAVSKHLQTLAHAGLVRDRRRGRERVFALELGRLDEARRALDRVSAQWDQALARLRRFVEEP